MSRPEQGGASYRAVLALPCARGLFTAALLARLAYGLQGLPLLLTLRAGFGSYAAAGLAASLWVLTIAVLGPARARLVQRRPRALPVLGVGYATSLAALAAASAGLPAAGIIALAVGAGLFPPPVGPVMRTRLSSLAPDDAMRQRALSLDTAAESTAFALGPALGGLLVAVFPAPAVLAGCGAALLTGTGLLARADRRARPPGTAGAVTRDRTRRQGPLRAAGFPPLLLLTATVAAAVSAVAIATVAAWGAPVAGVLDGLFAAGGVLGGLAYGRRRWPGRLGRRPLLLAAGSAACYALAALAFLPVVSGAALLLAGGCADILIVTSYQLVNVLVGEESRTEAGAWLNTAYNLGSAAGGAGGGFLIDRAGPHATLATVAAGVTVAVVAAAVPAWPGRLSRD